MSYQFDPTLEYCTAQRDSLDDLQFAVNELIREGWIPLGGILHDGHDYIQAMVSTE